MPFVNIPLIKREEIGNESIKPFPNNFKSFFGKKNVKIKYSLKQEIL